MHFVVCKRGFPEHSHIARYLKLYNKQQPKGLHYKDFYFTSAHKLIPKVVNSCNLILVLLLLLLYTSKSKNHLSL